MPAVNEADIQHIAQGLLHVARQARPRLYRGVSGWLLQRSLDDTVLRAALFRFIDVLPQLPDAHTQAQHLAAYLHDNRGLVPSALRLAARPTLMWLVTRQIRQLAQHFLLEENGSALHVALARLHAGGMTATLDAVGEAVLSEHEADAYRDRVLWQLAQDWGKQRPHVSIKLTALAPRFDPLDGDGTRAQLFSRLAPIIAAANARQATVTVDMEHYALKPLILDLFLATVGEFSANDYVPAIALQAYLPETREDIERIIAHARQLDRKLGIRLVKGAYWDQENAWAQARGWPMPCYTDKAATDANYENLTALLLQHSKVLLPAIASHNPRSLAVAIAHARQLNLSNSDWEIQMLHGMAEPLRDAVAAQGLPLRIYVPTGDLLCGIAYLIRRLLENTASNSVLRQTWLGHGAAADVLQAPVPEKAPAPPVCSANFPLSDFSQATMRNNFAAALQALQLSLPLQHDGKDDGEPAYTSRNPTAPDEILAHTRYTDLATLDSTLAAARTAQQVWGQRPVEQRIAMLEEVAERIASERHHFAALQVKEAAKPWREADADVAEAVDFLHYYCAQMRQLAGEHRTHDFPAEHNHYRYLPRGVAAVIAPWNFPLAILTGMCAAALVAGNAAVMKPALPGVLSARALQQTLLAVGVPPDLCPLLIGETELGAALVAHEAVDVIAFTGSRRVGLSILQTVHSNVQRQIKPVICEMGGKNAIIVDEDADLDEAVSGILASAFGYSGQKCSACSRLILVGNVGQHLLPRLVAAADTLLWGKPEDPAHEHGPLISAAAQQKALDYIAIGQREARQLWQGKVPAQGYYCPPTIFVDVQPQHRIAREEIFAPILAVLQAPHFNAALALANDCDYALTGGVYSRLPQHLKQAAERFRVGNLYFNRPITGARVGVQPFGGIALSGTGIQAGGPDYLKQFLWMQSLSHNVARHGFMP